MVSEVSFNLCYLEGGGYLQRRHSLTRSKESSGSSPTARPNPMALHPGTVGATRLSLPTKAGSDPHLAGGEARGLC